MSAIGFNHCNLRAPRELLDELRDFYCDVVGLVQGRRPPFESFGYWLYAGDHCVLHLSQTGPGEVRRTDIATTFDHVAFTCTNRVQMEAHLKQRNIPFKAGQVPALGISQLFIKDPAGNGIELSFSADQA